MIIIKGSVLRRARRHLPGQSLRNYGNRLEISLRNYGRLESFPLRNYGSDRFGPHPFPHNIRAFSLGIYGSFPGRRPPLSAKTPQKLRGKRPGSLSLPQKLRETIYCCAECSLHRGSFVRSLRNYGASVEAFPQKLRALKLESEPDRFSQGQQAGRPAQDRLASLLHQQSSV